MEFGTKIFFSLSRPISTRLAKNIAGKRFFIIFNFFALFFWNFLNRVEYERNSALKFFSLFLGLLHPVVDRNIAGKRFFNFLNFFAIFFGIFLPGSSLNGIRD